MEMNLVDDTSDPVLVVREILSEVSETLYNLVDYVVNVGVDSDDENEEILRQITRATYMIAVRFKEDEPEGGVVANEDELELEDEVA